MKIKIINLYNAVSQTLEGSPEHLTMEMVRLYPWLNKADQVERGSIDDLVKRLNMDQAFHAKILDYKEEPIAKSESNHSVKENELLCAMLGHNHHFDRALAAAKFLVGGMEPSADATRQALLQADGDVEEAALTAYGLEPSPANLKALRAVSNISDTRKDEQEPLEAAKVEPGVSEAQETAEQVQKAFQDHFVMPVKLGGRHSAGSLLARDHDSGNVWLLKPGSGDQSPSAGARQDPSTQSRREAAFYHVADAWGLNDYIPHTDLLLLNGREYAAIKLLPWTFHTMDKLKREDPGVPQRLLHGYLRGGILHKWAILDAVLGNADRHAANLMVKDDDIRLIDHGSAMAGTHFDPAHDKNSFVPYYLRAWAPGRFSKMDAENKLKYMPQVDHQTEEELRNFLNGLHAEDLSRILARYGVDPEPAIMRLNQLKTLATQGPVDAAVNKFWVET